MPSHPTVRHRSIATRGSQVPASSEPHAALAARCSVSAAELYAPFKDRCYIYSVYPGPCFLKDGNLLSFLYPVCRYTRILIPEIDNLIPEIVNTPNSYTRDRQKGGNIILEID